MADNVAVETVVTPGLNFATDDIGGVHHPKTKIEWGAADVATMVAAGASALPIQDGGNSITVDGAVSLAAAIPAGTNNIGDVDVASLPSLPAGANAIGTVEVTALPALPAGTNNIGDVDIASLPAVDLNSLPAADSQNIADIEAHVSRVTTATGPLAGAALATTALVAGGVYNSTPPTLTDTQQAALQLDANGALKVAGAGGGTQYTEGDVDATIVGNAILWEDAGNTLRPVAQATPLPVNIVAGAGSGGTASTDDAAFTPAAGSGTPAMGIVTADAVDAGDVGVFAMLANRQQKVTLYDSAGAELAVGGGTQYDEDTVHVSGDKVTMAGVVRADTAASLAGTDGDRTALIVDASGRLHTNVGALPALPAGTNNIGDVDVLSLPTLPAGDNNIGNVDIVTMPTVTVNAHAVTNAGTFVVQENGAALTALQLIDDAVKTDDAAFTPATDKVLMLGAFADETTPDAVNEGDAGVVRMTLNRGLHVNLRDAAGAELTPSQDATHDSAALAAGPQMMAVAGTTAPTAVTAGDAVRAWALPNGTLAVNLRDAAGAEVAVAGGTQYDEDTAHVSGDKVTMAGVVRVDTAAAQSGTTGDRTVLISDASGRLHVNVGVLPALAAGTNNIGDVDIASIAAGDNNIGNVDVVSLPALPAGTNNIGDVDVLSLPALPAGDNNIGNVDVVTMPTVTVNAQPPTSGGLQTHRSIDLDEGALEVVKASPGQVYGMWVSNLATATRFIKFYDATSGTVGTGTPKLTVPIPGNATDDISGAFGPGGLGIEFTTGICVGASTGIADADTGAPAANDVVVNIFYK